jgi:excisionase family DNA binding protein
MKPLETEDVETESGNGSEEGPDTAVERWAARLRPVSAKSELRQRAENLRFERPRTVCEAAEELGLSVHTIRAWIASRRLGHLRLGRAIRIPAAEIRRIIEESTVPAVREE